MNKIMMAFGFCFLIGLGLVSAASVSNVEYDYDKKTNEITVDYDLHLNKECIGSSDTVLKLSEVLSNN